jgi:anaerobic C4-dicarboxylate transporter
VDEQSSTLFAVSTYFFLIVSPLMLAAVVMVDTGGVTKHRCWLVYG